MNENELHVLYISGNDFVPYTGVSILSLLENNKSFDEIYIHILDRGINEINKDKLNNLCLDYNRKLFFHDITKDQFREILDEESAEKINMATSINTLYKLLIPSLFPNIKKILYIDADSLITDSLNDLWKVNINNYYVGAVEDLAILTLFPQIKERIGLKMDDSYINGGILLINLEKWRNENVESKFIDFLGNNKSFFMDQDVFNGILSSKTLILPLKYNVLTAFFEFSYDFFNINKLKSQYSRSEIDMAIENPTILHFAGSNIVPRPWHKSTLLSIGRYSHEKKLKILNRPHKNFNEKYCKYTKQSPWIDNVYIKDERGILGKLIYIIIAVIPFFSVLLVYIYRKMENYIYK